MKSGTGMKIGELADITGVAPSTIRFYESIGLITPERTSNGYRRYDREAILLLRIVTTAQSAGFSLDEIRNLLPTTTDGWQHDAMIKILQDKIASIEDMEKQLKRNKSQMRLIIETLNSRPEDVDCDERKQWVLDSLKEQEVYFRPKPKAKNGAKGQISVGIK